MPALPSSLTADIEQAVAIAERAGVAEGGEEAAP